MSFTTVIRPRRRIIGKAPAKPVVEPRPQALVRATLHLKTSSGA